ncbi:hypothetical protein O6H91_15G015800 [Diphasiastrum complanatum]|uniref:Uncharacterized protein n=1 Tax=Diphasiastrum complanatum TaxID=34168 RepID=A0ACC2BFZ8_DIPCM|nr:hypothetical protein O6H91_15G015800 [Diphasiastrum complanatum]
MNFVITVVMAMAKHVYAAYFSMKRFLRAIIATIKLCITNWALQVLACGPIPTHIGIIMDGNMRFASRSRINKRTADVFGYECLLQALDRCFKLGVKFVTVYSFSIDNFKHPSKEVSDLMELFEEKLQHLATKEPIIMKHSVQVHVLGDLILIPEGVRASAERAMVAHSY